MTTESLSSQTSQQDHPNVSNSDIENVEPCEVETRTGEIEANLTTTTDNDGNAKTNNNFPEHLGKHRQYWRDMILGVNDGLVSTFLLVAGVAGAGLSSTSILLTAISGALAGAVSMSSGEYVATKSQNEVIHGEIDLERLHIRNYKEEEIGEVSGLLKVIGIPEEQSSLQEQLIAYYRNHPEAMLKIMVALEFGVIEEEERSPLLAALSSGVLFFLGSLPSVLPFSVTRDNASTNVGLIVAAIATCISLLVVGAVKTWATRGNCVKAAIENVSIAGFGGAFAYGVGFLFEDILH